MVNNGEVSGTLKALSLKSGRERTWRVRLVKHVKLESNTGSMENTAVFQSDMPANVEIDNERSFSGMERTHHFYGLSLYIRTCTMFVSAGLAPVPHRQCPVGVNSPLR